jgi:hypothetical protein
MSEPGRNELPGFRSSDPDTSRQGAFDAYPRSGTHRLRALDVVWRRRAFGGATYEDVETATSIKGVWKRLSELKQGGWVRVEGTRKVSTGSQADIYYPTLKSHIWRRKHE